MSAAKTVLKDAIASKVITVRLTQDVFFIRFFIYQTSIVYFTQLISPIIWRVPRILLLRELRQTPASDICFENLKQLFHK
jgi:hypothetical protein